MGTDLKTVYEDALKAEHEGKKEEAIQLYEVAGSSGYPMAYIKLGDMQKEAGKDIDALEYYRLASLDAPSDQDIAEELRKRSVVINPSDESTGKKNDTLKAEHENTRKEQHQYQSLDSLMMLLVIVFCCLTVFHLIEFLSHFFSFNYLNRLFWDIIGVLICHHMSFLAEDADKLNRKVVNLEARIYELEKYKDYIKMHK
jgi:hypothetical protein